MQIPALSQVMMWRRLLATFFLFTVMSTAFAQTITLPDHPSADQKADIEQRLNDWPMLGRYASDNAALPPPKSPS